MAERHFVTLDGLKKEFGEAGEPLYREIARAGEFFDPSQEPTGYRPPLDIKSLRDAAADTHPEAAEKRKAAQGALAAVENLLSAASFTPSVAVQTEHESEA